MNLLYARVSTDRQEHEETIQSQLAELRARAEDDGLATWEEFLDEGYGRDNLVRPGLDRLRDLVAQEEVERVYIQAPDRLASGAKLMLLVEELQDHGVQIIFIKGQWEDTPEGKLLLHMQGAFSEYERTKIGERTRRGKLYWARQGAMVGGHAPYGYRLVRRNDSERARLEVSDFEATIVQEMYRLVLEERLSTRGLARRLQERGIRTPKGANQWSPVSISRMLGNPVYKGTFYYQRTEATLPAKRLTSDPYKQADKTGSKPRPEEDWIAIPVPAIVDEATWDGVQEQMRQNSLNSSRNNKKHQYLLRGLIRCPRCGGNYTGFFQHGCRGYRCQRAHWRSSSTGQRCPPGAFTAQPVEDAVWQAVTEALQQPQVLAEEYQKKIAKAASPEFMAAERKQLSVALKRLRAQEDRATDAYIGEAMELDRYKAEMEKLRKQKRELERRDRELDQRQQLEQDSRSALDHLDRFCRQVTQGLDALSFEERQQLLKLLVEKVTVEAGRARIETVIPAEQDNLRNLRGDVVTP